MPRAALVPLAFLLALVPARSQQIQGTYPRNDLEGLRHAVEGAPDNAGLRLRLAQALLRTGKETAHPDAAQARLKEADDQFQKILELDPDARVPLRVLAFDGYQTRRFEQTVECGRRLLSRVPGDIEISRFVLKALVRLRRKDEAVRFLVEWLQRGTTPSLGMLQGTLYTLSLDGEFRQSLESALDAAIAARPTDVQMPLYKAILLAETGRNEAAWKVMHEAEARGLCDARSGERHDFARALAAKTVEHGANPVRYSGNDLAEIEEALRRAPDHVGLLLRRARVLDLAGRRDEAVAAYGAALAKNPDLWPALVRRGELLMDGADAAAAAADFEKARTLYPEIAVARHQEILARVRAGPQEKAVARLVEEAGREQPTTRVVEALDLAAKDDALATALEKALREAAAARPKSPYVPAHLSLLLRARGRADEARTQALEAERRGLAGPDAYPNRVVFWAFEAPLPEALTKDPDAR